MRPGLCPIMLPDYRIVNATLVPHRLANAAPDGGGDAVEFRRRNRPRLHSAFTSTSMPKIHRVALPSPSAFSRSRS